MSASRRRFAALLLLAWSPSCREHSSICPNGECDADGTGGQAAPGGAAGQAGSSSDDCDKDADCQDDSVCNGSERCQHGVCKPGAAVECEHGLVCTEGASASCRATSPWAFFFTQRALLGLPTAELGLRPLATLGEIDGNVNPLWGGFDWPVFSPDGSRLLLTHLASAGTRLFEVELGDGLPSFRPAPDVPYPGIFGLPRFTRDGRSVLITDDYSGAYWIDLAAEKTWRVSDRWGDRLGTFAPCGKNSWVSGATFSRFGRLTGDDVAETTFGVGPTSVSPDQRYVLWHANEERTVLIDCLDIGKRIDVSASTSLAYWSPDARHFSLDDADGIFRVFAIDEAGNAEEAWSAPSVQSSYWSDDGAHLIVVTDDGWFSLAISHGEVASPRALALSDSPELQQIDASGVLAWVDAEDGSSKQLILADHGGGTKVLLAEEPLESWLFTDWTRGRAFLLRPADDHEELLMLTFDEGEHHERLLFTNEGSLHIELASDGSGLVLVLRDEGALSTYWLALPSDPEAKLPEPLALEEGTYDVTFQPWP